MNNEITPEQIAATEKATAVINSCTRCDHFKTVIPYLELFLKQFNDQTAYNDLVLLFKTKQQEFNCYELIIS